MRYCVILWYDQGFLTYVSEHDLTVAGAKAAAEGWAKSLGITQDANRVDVEVMK